MDRDTGDVETSKVVGEGIVLGTRPRGELVAVLRPWTVGVEMADTEEPLALSPLAGLSRGGVLVHVALRTRTGT